MIELKNVSKYYSNNGIVTLGLRNINLSLQSGEIVAITGDSGSGKSTLLNVITAVDSYEEGEIYFEGNETSYFNQNDMDMFRKNNVSFIFQNYNIIDSYTVLENVMIPLLLIGKSQEEAKKEAKNIIDKVGLSKRIHHKGTKLSGGEKQRCVIARALASDSKILACDEPTGNLDSQTGDEIIKLIQEVAQDRLVLIVTHNYNQIRDIATRRIKMSDGEVIEDVQLKEITSPNETKEFSLEEKKLKKSVFFKLAMQNILSTPKKTIFTSLVFLVISFITLVLCLMMLERSYETYYNPIDAYNLKTKDRLIVYDRDHKPLDTSVFDGLKYNAIYYNAFYEETAITINVRKNAHNNSVQVCLTHKKLNYTLIDGKEMKEEGEYFLVIPSGGGYYYEYVNSVNAELFSNDYKRLGKITGVAESNEISFPYLLCYDEFPEELLSQWLYRATIVKFYQIDGQEENELFVQQDNSVSVPYISCPTKYENHIQFSFYLNSVYKIYYDHIVFEDRFEVPVLVASYTLTGFEPEIQDIYEATIYTDNLKSVKTALEKKGLGVSIPNEQNIKASTFNLIYLYLFLALTLMALVSLFFISYVILARVYASKNKDYGVLRTLGMVKQQLGKIVILEVILIGILSTVISLVVFIIAYHTTDVFTMGKFMNFGIILFYFVLMLIFSYFLARRFNRRLYKFTVSTTVKGEVARND